MSKFSFTFPGYNRVNFVVLNAGATVGFTVDGIDICWPSEGDPVAAEPTLSVTRYTGNATGGTPGDIFGHNDGDVPLASALLLGTTPGSGLGSSPNVGPTFAIGKAGAVNAFLGVGGLSSPFAFYLIGGTFTTNFGGSPISVAPGNSLVIETQFVSFANVYFHED